ncbi:leucine-rich repeat-containing protein 36 [Gastrophryne carolinensis]
MRRVHLRESLVCERVGLRSGGADTVESLSLQGTHREKIVSLGDAFKNFKSLRSLDLSRNIIINLQGIEYLHSLCHLNLYYNDIASVEEIKHLRPLVHLKSLDLRLNPVTRQDADYRLFVIYNMGSLDMLDERPVRESEKKMAKYNFQTKSLEMLEGETGRPSHSKLFEDKGRAKAHLDFNLSTKTDLDKIVDQEKNSSDNRKSSSPSKNQSDEHQSYLHPQPDFEDGIEYRPLPSPTRSSLRSPGPSSRAKEGHRVTFAHSEFSSKKDDLAKNLKNMDDYDDISTRDAVFSYSDKPGTAFSFRNPHLTSTPVRKDAAGSETIRAGTLYDRDRISTDSLFGSERIRTGTFDNNEKIRAGDLHDTGKSLNSRDYLKPAHSNGESSTERLLRLSSDLYITTHLPEPPTYSSSLSALRKGLNDISKTYALPSKPTLTNTHLPTAKPASLAELTRDYKSTWSPERTSALHLSQSGMKRSSSLNSLLPPKTYDDYSDSHEDLYGVNELKKRENSPSRREAPLVSEVLQQLIDLVDRYWNGSGSLLHNQRFMAPARDLLTHLLTSNSATQMSSGSSALLPNSRSSHRQLEDGDSIESVKLKLIKVMEENHFLRSKVYKLENQVTRKEGAENHPPSQDDLHQKYEQLSLQVESLQQQLVNTHKLQETVGLLHNRQKSLQNTNEYLLQQLNKISPAAVCKPSHPSRISTDKYHLSETTDSLTRNPAYSSSQYRNPERLSACPI